jgi:hypothetical protein
MKEAAGQNREDLYSDVFSIVSRLSDSRISVQRVSITVVPMGNTATCEMDTVRKWWGKISFEEIIASYCQRSQP